MSDSSERVNKFVCVCMCALQVNVCIGTEIRHLSYHLALSRSLTAALARTTNCFCQPARYIVNAKHMHGNYSSSLVCLSLIISPFLIHSPSPLSHRCSYGIVDARHVRGNHRISLLCLSLIIPPFLIYSPSHPLPSLTTVPMASASPPAAQLM